GNTLIATATTANDGSFAFTNLPPGIYRLEAQKPGMAGSVLHGIRVPEMTGVILILKPGFDATACTTPPTLLITQDGN
ncbi:carboxypeptidase-like regulatory domain-containing protein, partial [Shewanella sp. C31]|nr:carboxypeptidase-like regulatory domain-containing protein [Shewanella electrica]